MVGLSLPDPLTVPPMKLTNRTQRHKVSKKVLLKNGAKKRPPIKALRGAL
jgi:hypothetical protein